MKIPDTHRNVEPFIFAVLSTLLVFAIGCAPKGSPHQTALHKNIAEEVNSLVCEEPTWNIGEIDTTNGVASQHEFLLKNTTAVPIYVERVDSTCGCLVADDYDRVVQPGDSTKLQCTITLPPFPGQIKKFLFVQARGEKPVRLQLTILATAALNPMLHTFPEKVDFGVVKPGAKQTRDVIVRRYDKTPVQYRHIENLSEHPELSVSNEAADENGVKLKVVLDTTGQLIGSYQANLKILSDHEKFPELVLPLKASIQNEDSAFVSLIFIDRLSIGESKTCPIWKQSETRSDIVITNIIYEGDSALSACFQKSDKPGDEKVSITRNKDLTSARIAKGSLKIVLQRKGGDEEEEHVDVTAFLPAN